MLQTTIYSNFQVGGVGSTKGLVDAIEERYILNFRLQFVCGVMQVLCHTYFVMQVVMCLLGVVALLPLLLTRSLFSFIDSQQFSRSQKSGLNVVM